jgi:hypothetical protein
MILIQKKEKKFLDAIKIRNKIFERKVEKFWLLKSKRARHFCRPFVLTNPLNSIAKLQFQPT